MTASPSWKVVEFTVVGTGDFLAKQRKLNESRQGMGGCPDRVTEPRNRNES